MPIASSLLKKPRLVKKLKDFYDYVQKNDGKVGTKTRGIVLNFLDKPEKAIKDLNQAIKLDPDNISIIGSYFERGKYYLEKKQLSESIKDFSFFIDIYEKNVLSGDNLEREALGLCYVDRAHAYDSIGEYEKAFNDLRRSAELDCELAKKILNNQIQK